MTTPRGWGFPTHQPDSGANSSFLAVVLVSLRAAGTPEPHGATIRLRFVGPAMPDESTLRSGAKAPVFGHALVEVGDIGSWRNPAGSEAP